MAFHKDNTKNSPARRATLPRGSFWWAKLATSDDLGNFLTRVTTFHDLRMTLTNNGNNIWRPWRPVVKTLWWPWRLVGKTLWWPLLRLTTTLWLPRMTSLMTHVMTLTTSMIFIVSMIETKSGYGRLMTLCDDMVNFVWWPMWLLLTTCDDQSDDQNTTLMTLMITGD